MRGVMMMAGAMMAGTAMPSGAQQAAQDVASCVLARPAQTGFSGVVAVARGGQVTVVPRGTVGPPTSPAITAATRFNIGSAGKMFTAVAVGQLVDAGKVRLDDPIGKYVEGITPEAGKVTVRQLLTHSGGLGNFFTPDAVPTLKRITALKDLLPLIAGETPRFPPGSRFEYSNSGFALLGMLVERVSGIAYAEYLAAHVFRPAGMTATGPAFDPATTAEGATSGGGLRMLPPPGSPGGPPPGEAPSRLPPPSGESGMAPPPGGGGPLRPAPEATMPATPAGGMFSTAEDMTRFFRALAAGTLLRLDTMRAFTSRQIEAGPARGDLPPLYYGYGFGTSSFAGHRWIGHNGGAPGVNAEAIMFPDDDVVLVVLANRDPPSATKVFRAVRDAVLKTGEGC